MSGSPVPPLKRLELAEARRVRAVELFGQGCSNAGIAGMVGAHAESVRRWRRTWENGGAQALRRRPTPGRRIVAAGGHLLPRQGHDGRVEFGLVALDGHQAVGALLLHQPFRVFVLGVEGVGGHRGAGQIETGPAGR
ncbi:helix-turn-helix domain-containing protein [Streptomyces sp. NPDC127051]|uniref:helix-turn-helix domain-containing protein n=1 Tax=Streptomyces sp. NPDC127051 TaxID=3347119 RepID=UPI003659FC50